MTNSLIIIGCGGYARSAADVALYNDPNLQITFLDQFAKDGEKIFDFPVLPLRKTTEKEEIFLAIGDNSLRAKEAENHHALTSLIAKTSFIGRDVQIAAGVFIGHNCYVGPLVKIGKNSIINHSASVSHECEIGDNCHIAPNSTICGRSKIGNNVFICAGSTIINNITIADNVTIGAGSVVARNILESGTYFGNPARKIK